MERKETKEGLAEALAEAEALALALAAQDARFQRC